MITVSAAVIIEDNRVLVSRRAKGQQLAGYWEFPGGKVESNEDVFQCLGREMLEEFSVEISAEEVFAESVYDYDQGTIKLVAINASLHTSNFRFTVQDRVLMVPINELVCLRLAPADIPIAKRLMELHEG